MTQEEKLELYNKAKEAYYLGEQIMSDQEFDKLEKELGFENIQWVLCGGVITTHGGPAAIGMAGFTKE